jgi:outer membrane protein, heavy metal efflux system
MKQMGHYLTFALTTWFFFLATASAQKSETISLTLEEALRLSLLHSPEIKKIDAALAQKLAAATEAQLPENPELEMEGLVPANKAEDLRITPKYNVQLTQPFRLSHFGLRQTYAAALKQTANVERQADLLRVLNETVLLYYRLWMLQKKEVILADSEQQAQEVVARIAEALEKRETPATEGNLFKAEAIRFGVELKSTQAERLQAEADLLAAMGSPRKPLQLTEPRLKPIPTDLFKLTGFAQGRANLQRLVEQKQRAAARRYDVARLDTFPQLSLRGLYERSADGRDQEWGAGLVVRVPVWDWNQAELQRAKAENAVAVAEARAFDRLTFDRLVEIRHKQATAAQTRAEAYWQQVIPAYLKSYELSRHMFDQGQVNMLQLWQVQQKVTEATDTALRNTVEALAARTMLEQAIGGKIEEISE